MSALFIYSANLYAGDVLTIRSDRWFPMNGLPDAEKPGYMIEMAQTIMAHHGYQVDYQLSPWKRSLQEVRAGKHDCVVGAYQSEARDLLFPKEEWGMDRVDFYVKAGNNWRYKGFESLNEIKLGLIGGYIYNDDFNNYVKSRAPSDKLQWINEDNSLELNIRKILRGRISATLESVNVMQAKLQQLGLSDKIVPAGTLKAGEPMYIACSPAKPSTQKFIRWLTDGTRRIRDNGQLKQILVKYGLSDWKSTVQ